MSTYQEDIKVREKKLREQAEAVRIYNFYCQHPEIVSCDANNQIIKSFFEGSKITEQSLEDALRHTSLLQQLATQTRTDAKARILEEEAEERKELARFIIENRAWATPDSKAGELARFLNPKATNIETLRQIKSNILQRRALQEKSIPELQEIAKGEQPSRWRPVPKIYRTRAMMLSLVNSTDIDGVAEFKKLLRLCGNDAIQAILNQPD